VSFLARRFESADGSAVGLATRDLHQSQATLQRLANFIRLALEGPTMNDHINGLSTSEAVASLSLPASHPSLFLIQRIRERVPALWIQVEKCLELVHKMMVRPVSVPAFLAAALSSS